VQRIGPGLMSKVCLFMQLLRSGGHVYWQQKNGPLWGLWLVRSWCCGWPRARIWIHEDIDAFRTWRLVGLEVGPLVVIVGRTKDW